MVAAAAAERKDDRNINIQQGLRYKGEGECVCVGGSKL